MPNYFRKTRENALSFFETTFETTENLLKEGNFEKLNSLKSQYQEGIKEFWVKSSAAKTKLSNLKPAIWGVTMTVGVAAAIVAFIFLPVLPTTIIAYLTLTIASLFIGLGAILLSKFVLNPIARFLIIPSIRELYALEEQETVYREILSTRYPLQRKD